MKTKIQLLAAFFLLSCSLKAQTNLNSFTFGMFYISTGEVQHTVTATENRTDTIYKRVCAVDLPSTTINKIHVMVGTKKDFSDIFSYSFLNDDSQSLQNPMTYIREGNKAFLGLFNTVKTDMYYYKVWLEDVNGTLSTIKYFY